MKKIIKIEKVEKLNQASVFFSSSESKYELWECTVEINGETRVWEQPGGKTEEEATEMFKKQLADYEKDLQEVLDADSVI